jgi:hypothetical protein
MAVLIAATAPLVRAQPPLRELAATRTDRLERKLERASGHLRPVGFGDLRLHVASNGTSGALNYLKAGFRRHQRLVSRALARCRR